jgi:hypothetical protein
MSCLRKGISLYFPLFAGRGRRTGKFIRLITHKIAVGVPLLGIVQDGTLLSGPQSSLARWRHPKAWFRHNTPHVGPVFVEGVDETARSAGVTGKCNIDLTVDVPDPKRRKPCGKRCVCKRIHECEAIVVDIHLVVRVVSGKQKLLRGLAGNFQTSGRGDE